MQIIKITCIVPSLFIFGNISLVTKSINEFIDIMIKTNNYKIHGNKTFTKLLSCYPRLESYRIFFKPLK